MAGTISARKADISDIPLMSAWFNDVSKGLGIRADRSSDHWHYLLDKSQSSFETAVDRRILLDGKGKPAGWLGFQRECFGPTLAIAEASLPGASMGWSAEVMLALAESIRAEEGLPHITVLLPLNHPVAVLAAELGGELCMEYAWQVALLDRSDFFGLLRPVLEARLVKSGWQGRARRMVLDLYAGGLQLDWDGRSLDIVDLPGKSISKEPGGITSATDQSQMKSPEQSSELPGSQPGSQPVDGIDTMTDTPVSSFPPELLGPLVLGYRSWQELGHCRRDVRIRPEDRPFMDALFPVMDSFIYPLF